MTNAGFNDIGSYRAIESLNHYAESVAAGDSPGHVLAGLRVMSRDNARTPMQWDDSPHAGSTTGIPSLAVNPNRDRNNVEAEQADSGSVLDHYRALIALRHTEQAVTHGDFTMLLPQDNTVYAFTRRFGGTVLLALGNVSGSAASAPVPQAEEWAASELVLSTGPSSAAEPNSPAGRADDAAAALTLGPWEARVYRRCIPLAGRVDDQ